MLECVPKDLTKKIVSKIKIPSIWIGAGPETDGQIMVCYDVLGAYSWDSQPQPKFVKNFMIENESIKSAFESYVREVKAKTFPSEQHSFKWTSLESHKFIRKYKRIRFQPTSSIGSHHGKSSSWSSFFGRICKAEF